MLHEESLFAMKRKNSMDRNTHKSEYLQTLQQIEQEHEVAQRGLLGPAVVARHDFIEARLSRGADHILELIEQHRLSDAIRLMDHACWGEEELAETDPKGDLHS
jgi:hypothetical protein